MLSIQHRNYKISKKNKIITMNIDDDYDILKSIYCYLEGLVSQNVKDTRRLSVQIMNKLGDPNNESVTICSNLLRGIKSKMNRS